MKCTVHRIPNDFRIADSARVAIALNQCRLSSDVVGHSTGLTVDQRLDVVHDEYPHETSWLLQSLTNGVVMPCPALTKLPSYLLSHSVGLVPSNEDQLVIHDSVRL